MPPKFLQVALWPRIALLSFVLLVVFQPGFGKGVESAEEPSKEVATPIEFKFAFDVGGETAFPIIQDKEGFIWTGSFFHGAVRFDGYGTKSLRLDKDGISSRYVTQIFEDSEGLFWIGTDNGLNVYNKKNNQITLFKSNAKDANSLVSNIFNLSSSTITEDDLGRIWIGTQNGLSCYDKKTGKFTNYRHDPGDSESIAGNDIFSIHFDRQGFLWVASKDKGLSRFDKTTGKFIRFTHNPSAPDSIPANDIASIAEQGDCLWFGTLANGLLCMEKKTGRFSQFIHNPETEGGLPRMAIWNIVVLRSGKLVLLNPSAGAGLVFFDPQTRLVEIFNQKDNLSGNSPQNVLEDRSGIFWVMHSSGKVDRFDPMSRKFGVYYPSPGGDSGSAPIPLFEDKNGDFWIGHYGGGLFKLDRKTGRFTHFNVDSQNPKSLPHGYPCGFYEDESGFYVSTADGITLFDRAKGEVAELLTRGTFLYSFQKDPRNPDLLWSSGWVQGLRSVNKKTREVETILHDPQNADTPANDTALVSMVDPENPSYLYLATWGGGLDRFDTETRKFVHFKHDPENPSSISNDTVYDIHIDSHGNFWVCTQMGLNKFDKKTVTFKHLKEPEAFANAVIHNLLEDDYGFLWIATNIGLINFHIATEKVAHIYTKEDGLHSHNFFANSRLKTRDGMLWFGGLNGLNYFDPGKIRHNETPPPIYLTSLTRGGIPIPVNTALEKLKELQLDWRQNGFEFEYTALNYTNSLKNEYQYMLEGFDQEWFNAKSVRIGRYASLPGGTYMLKIRGSNNDGVWCRPEQEVALSIVVSSPPWLTWYAYLLYTVLTGAGIYLYLWWKMRSSEAMRKDLAEQVAQKTIDLEKARDAAETSNKAKSIFLANMSHEIRTPMNGVLGMAELLSHTPLGTGQREQLAMLRTSGEDLLMIINDILDFSKIEAGRMELEAIGFSMHDLFGRTLQALGPQAAAKNLEIELAFSDDFPDLRLGDPNRLRQVLTNLVSNAIKFTERGWVRVAVMQVSGPHGLRVEVTDTGEGISPEAQAKLFKPFSQADASTTRKHGGTGLGLVISARIIEQMGGHTGVTSAPGHGSTFWFELALPPAAPEQVVSPDYRMPDALLLLAGKRVLLVDDNAVNRAVAGSLMRRWDMKVTEAVDGPAALAQMLAVSRANDVGYDLAVLDGAMPGMDGWQLAAAIRKIPGCAALPLVMASSSGLEATHSPEENSLFRRFLLKPLRPAQLAGALAEALTDWQPERTAPVSKATRSAKVLLVEDTKINQMVARSMLEKGGHQVTLAENGVEALAQLEQPGLFDIVLMDCQMPDMDGFEATRQLRLREQERGWKPYRVVAMTANAMQSDREACLEAGMDGYLAKPVRMDQLLKMVAGE